VQSSEHAPQGSPWIEVRGDWLQQDEGIYELVQKAKARGLMLVWGGSLADVPDADAARCFASSLLSLPPEGAAGLPNAVRPASRQRMRTRRLPRAFLPLSP
jgi:hypothetical protein